MLIGAKNIAFGVVGVLLAVSAGGAATLLQEGLSAAQVELVRVAAWGAEAEAEAALQTLTRQLEPSGRAVSREVFLDLEEILREGPPVERTPARKIGDHAEIFEVALPDGRRIPVLVQLPPGYSQANRWPLVLAMHGGPPGSEEGALRSAAGMLEVWREAAAEAGWLVVSPAMTHVRSMGPRTEARLPYEVLRPEQAAAILSVVQRRYRVDPDRIVSTGISLGSNFSIAFGAATPDRFAAIVPVSTEGDSREHLLRNLQHVPTYVLEGTQDRNIRGINGPRALGDILARFAYDATYREFGDRAHEGFQELYSDVLRWAAVRPRDPYPDRLLRVPHDGIMPLARRVFWLESDTRQGLVSARVSGDNAIDIEVRRARRLTLYLHDRLVDLDRPIAVTVNGVVLPPITASRRVTFALQQVRALDDGSRGAAASVMIEVPGGDVSIAAGRRLSERFEPVQREGRLSFWEYYAVNALNERFPALGIEGVETDVPADVLPALVAGGFAPANEGVGVRIDAVDPEGPFAGSGIRAGDLLLEVGGEPFFAGNGGLDGLHHWLTRELVAAARDYELVVWRDGGVVSLSAALALGPYR